MRFSAAANVAVVGVERDAQALERPRDGAPQLEPAPVHAVARPVDVAAGNALVRLHEVEAFASPGRARGARERPVAPQVADMERIDAQERGARPSPLPCARSASRRRPRARSPAARARRSAPRRRTGCSAGARWRASSLEADRRSPSSSRAAACTASTGRQRQALAHLAAAAAVMPARAALCVVVTTRWLDVPRPHSVSPLGPKSATSACPSPRRGASASNRRR